LSELLSINRASFFPIISPPHTKMKKFLFYHTVDLVVKSKSALASPFFVFDFKSQIEGEHFDIQHGNVF